MRKIFFCLLILAFFGSCAGTGSHRGAEPHESSADRQAASSAALSLLAAIEASGEIIAGELPPNSRVVIVAFESSGEALSRFIMEELTGALFNRGIEVADRQNLEFVYRELNFQMSGDLSDETAKSIGRFLGADMVITGQLTHMGSSYRYRTSAIHVEQATLASVTRLTVENDREMRQLVEALTNQDTSVTSIRYGVSEDTLPHTAGSFLDRGIMFLRQGEHDSALSDFNMAIRFNPNMGMAYWLRARVSFANVAAAPEIPSRSTANRRPSDPLFVFDGWLLEERNRAFAQIQADYGQAIRLIPNDSRIYLERAHFNQYRFFYAAAYEDYNQVIRLDPNTESAFVGRGELFLGASLQGEWIVNLANWMADRQQAGQHRELQIERDLDKAIAEFNQAIRINPQYALAYFRRGIAYSRKGDYARAIADFDRALQLSPDDSPNRPLIHFERGMAYYRTEDFNRAVTDLEAAVRINPNVYSWNNSLRDVRRNQAEVSR